MQDPQTPEQILRLALRTARRINRRGEQLLKFTNTDVGKTFIAEVEVKVDSTMRNTVENQWSSTYVMDTLLLFMQDINDLPQEKWKEKYFLNLAFFNILSVDGIRHAVAERPRFGQLVVAKIDEYASNQTGSSSHLHLVGMHAELFTRVRQMYSG